MLSQTENFNKIVKNRKKITDLHQRQDRARPLVCPISLQTKTMTQFIDGVALLRDGLHVTMSVRPRCCLASSFSSGTAHPSGLTRYSLTLGPAPSTIGVAATITPDLPPPKTRCCSFLRHRCAGPVLGRLSRCAGVVAGKIYRSR
jgi:hypothetical protein